MILGNRSIISLLNKCVRIFSRLMGKSSKITQIAQIKSKKICAICVIFDQAFIFMVAAWLLLLLVRGRHHHWQRWHKIQIDNKHLDEDPSGAVLIQLNE